MKRGNSPHEWSIDNALLKNTLKAAGDAVPAEAQRKLAQLSSAFPRRRRKLRRLLRLIRGDETGPWTDGCGGCGADGNGGGYSGFRIAVTSGETTPEERVDVERSFVQLGARLSGEGARCARQMVSDDLDSTDNFPSGIFVTTMHPETGDRFVLCYDDSAHALTHARPLPWSVAAGVPRTESAGAGIMMPFMMNLQGAKYMEQLTTDT